MTYEEKLSELKELISKIEYLKYTMNSLIYWDKITYMPPEGIAYRSKVMAYMADLQYQLMSQPSFSENVAYLTDHEKNDDITNAMLRRIRRNSEYVSKIPEQEYRQYTELIALAEQVWEQARRENDFAAFLPDLEKIFATFRQFAEYWGYEADPYDALLGYYEEGLCTTQVDAFIAELKPFLIQSIARIQARPQAQQEDCFSKLPQLAKSQQQKLWEIILSRLGFRFAAGRIDIGAHPTILANSPNDVRIVNSYDPADLKSGIFNVLHCGGKGIYQQSISPRLLGTSLAEVASFALEEGVGRFYEHVIGRNEGFWNYFYPQIAALIPAFAELSPHQIYCQVNTAQPSFCRIEADELTDLLHIIIRYELERELIGGQLAPRDLPDAWNQKYQDYLNIRPQNHSQGVLQDIHWAAGYVGYFPSYIAAALSSAQIGAAIESSCGSIEKLTGRGQFQVIKDWLTEHLFCFGALYPTPQLIHQATKEPLNSKYYTDYLRKKYSARYSIKL